MSCKIGFHSFSEWEYETSGKCIMVRKCKRCATLDHKAEPVHPMGEWSYAREGSCENIRTCSRCSHREKQIEHTFGPWDYKRAQECDKLRTCARCGDVESKKEHTWDSWHYEAPKSCNQLRFCIRCQERETRKAIRSDDHAEWSDWDYANRLDCTAFQRHCLQCGQKENSVKSARHQYSEWKRVSANLAERTCLRCRKRELERVQAASSR